jgi:hypothetical protein
LSDVDAEAEPTPYGVVFPELDGARSTSAVGRSVVWASLSELDPDGARAAGRASNWRRHYSVHLRRVLEAGLPSATAAQRVAAAGLTEAQRRMQWADATGERSLAQLVAGPARPASAVRTQRVRGSARPATFALPVRGVALSGAALSTQLSRWVESGALEPSAAAAVRTVSEHPEWLSLPGRTVVCLGAGAEIGPVRPLLAWGATVAAIDLPGAARWSDLTATAGSSAGTLVFPVREGIGEVLDRAGADLLTELPTLIDWVRELGSGLVIGNYTYADGGAHVALATACDSLALGVRHSRTDLTLAFLATPTDVFAVPPEAVAASAKAYAERGALVRGIGPTLRVLSRGRALRANYPQPPDEGPAVHDAIVRQQGPNYSLAKQIQRWRATTELMAGRRVSINVAPPTRTVSVLKNRALAAAYAGAHRFGVEVFEPETTRVLMAALLVHDLNSEPGSWSHPWQLEADQAVHGGLWRAAYAPRGALPLAALAGLPATLFHQGQ